MLVHKMGEIQKDGILILITTLLGTEYIDIYIQCAYYFFRLVHNLGLLSRHLIKRYNKNKIGYPGIHFLNVTFLFFEYYPFQPQTKTENYQKMAKINCSANSRLSPIHQSQNNFSQSRLVSRRPTWEIIPQSFDLEEMTMLLPRKTRNDLNRIRTGV